MLRTVGSAVFAFAVALFSASAAHAQDCGSDVQVTGGVTAGNYDPFSPVPVTFGGVSLTFTRAIAASGGGKTQTMHFYMRQAVGSPAGNQVIWPDTSENILFTAGGFAPTFNNPSSPSQPAGVATVDWGGAAQPDVMVKTVQVTIDPSYDPVAQPTIDFDLVYVCKGTGGYSNVSTPVTLTGVIHISINVLSGLQASYAGPPLDFGDLSEVGSGGAAESGLFHVRSSGAFNITLTSGNHFLMTYPGGPSAPDPGTIGYALTFVGQTRQYGNETFTIPTCHRAGTNAVQYIPITATLLEGGVGKTPAPNYADQLTVTFSPIADPGTTQPFCSSPTP
jgi:hypothetical protein